MTLRSNSDIPASLAVMPDRLAGSGYLDSPPVSQLACVCRGPSGGGCKMVCGCVTWPSAGRHRPRPALRSGAAGPSSTGRALSPARTAAARLDTGRQQQQQQQQQQQPSAPAVSASSNPRISPRTACTARGQWLSAGWWRLTQLSGHTSALGGVREQGLQESGLGPRAVARTIGSVVHFDDAEPPATGGRGCPRQPRRGHPRR